MPYTMLALLSTILFALVHLWAEKAKNLGVAAQGKLLSAGGGLSIAFVFVDLLPKLSKSDLTLREALTGLFPFIERHVYVMALMGFLLFFIVDRSRTILHGKGSFWLTIASYALFNFLVGYAIVDKYDPEVQPLFLFTIAMGLHYFVNDYSLCAAHGDDYRHTGRWILIISLFAGWLVGFLFILPGAAVALVSAFIAGGVIMNVTRHELPEENPHNLRAFLLSALIYTIVLLCIGY